MSPAGTGACRGPEDGTWLALPALPCRVIAYMPRGLPCSHIHSHAPAGAVPRSYSSSAVLFAGLVLLLGPRVEYLSIFFAGGGGWSSVLAAGGRRRGVRRDAGLEQTTTLLSPDLAAL